MTREMKNSGIEWIGQIPADWIIRKVKNVCSIYTGNSIKDTEKDNYTDSENAIPYIATKEIDTSSSQINYDNGMYVKKNDENFRVAPQNSTLMCIEGGSAGKKIAYLNQDVCFVNKLCCFSAKTLDDKFLYYYLKSPSFNSEFNLHISGLIGGVSQGELREFSIVVPPLTEQKKIADFLDSKVSEIDKMIAETKSSIENYKEYKQSVITEAVTKGLNKDVQMKDSGVAWLGNIPSNRSVITPKALFSLRKEKAKQGERQLTASQQYGVIYQDEYMKLTDTRVVTVEKDFDILKHVEKGDFVISMRSFQGGIEYSENTGSISSAYVMLIPNLKYVYSPFYKWLLKSSAYIKALQSTSNLVRDGQAMRYSNFAQVPLFTVPLEEQREIAEFLDAKCAEIENLIAEKEALVSNLEEYKKSLIYEYVTGKKEVSTAKNDETVIVTPIYPAVYQAKSKRFAQAVLMSKILDTSNNNKGRVKLEKTLYTIEHHIGFDFETEYTRDAAGPLDNSLYKCETIISRNNKWFNINSRNYRVSYKPTKNVDKYKYYYNNYFADYDTEIERIISIFDGFNTDQAEIIATLYGAWNDFIIDNKPFTADDVVNEVLNNWHDSKKRFSKDIWLRAMEKMRTLDLVPKGYGKKTISKEV